MKKKIVIMALVLSGVITVPSIYHFYQRTRAKSSQPCWGRLLNIAAAKEQWMLEKHASSGATVTIENILPYLGRMPTCNIAGATYLIGKIGEEPRCTMHGTVSQFKPDTY